MTLAPNLQIAAGLVGRWTGPGRGHYPTIPDFEYVEDSVFADIGKPFLHYLQRTRSADGAPMHTETGYLRVPDAGRAEWVLALPTGHTELAEGTLRTEDAPGTEDVPGSATDAPLVLETRAAIRVSSSAKEVSEVSRRYVLDGDSLVYDLWMAAVGEELTHHLHADLQRTAPDA